MNNNKTNKPINNIDKDRNTYFDTIQIGPLEEEITHEFYFDTEQFKEYLKEKELDKIQDKKTRN
jgi:hypothetical protein